MFRFHQHLLAGAIAPVALTPPSKVSNSVTRLVLELAAQQKDPAEIAQMLNLKTVQVSTLLAYHA